MHSSLAETERKQKLMSNLYEEEPEEGTYGDFASVYDELMDDVPYDDWFDYIHKELIDHGIEDGLVLDLGCGSGIMTERLARAGYDMTGVDLSEDMLSEAIKKRDKSGLDILYLCQDMRSFELYGTMRAIICICDCVNYILDADELTEMFKLVNNYLDPDGVFIFDVNTTHKYRDEIGDCTIAENREDCSFIWDNTYDEETGINEYALTLFIKDKESGLFRRSEEVHYQRGYELSEIKKMLSKAGLVFERAFDTDTRQEPDENTERFTVIAREHGKSVNK